VYLGWQGCVVCLEVCLDGVGDVKLTVVYRLV